MIPAIHNRQSKINMSLRYEREPEQIEAVEDRENVQRAIYVKPYYSIGMAVFLAAVWLAQLMVDGRNSLLLGGEKSILLAGFVKPAFLGGQYWRILTGAVLHGGLLHLAFNCYALYVLGRLIETLSNRAHLVIIFILSAIGGGVLSLVFLPDIISIGASGGIVGFLGYLTVYGYLRRELLTNAFLKNMLFNVAFIAFTGIFVLPNVDNFGHLGGLIVGAVYGFLQIPRDLHVDPRKISGAAELFGYAALGVFIFTSLLSILLISGVIRL